MTDGVSPADIAGRGLVRAAVKDCEVRGDRKIDGIIEGIRPPPADPVVLTRLS